MELLNKAFLCVKTQRFNTIKQTSCLKLKKEDDPYTYISQIRNLQQSIDNLDISQVDFLHYVLWEGPSLELKKNIYFCY